MYNHAPEGYSCPFCRLSQQQNDDDCACTVYHDDVVTAFIGSHKWPNNPGHVIVIPNEHHENIYDLPIYLATKIHECARAVALAMKVAYACEGVSTRQHNEPDGGQDVWHYHLHVFPRFKGDKLYQSQRVPAPAAERLEYARKLGMQLKDWTLAP